MPAAASGRIKKFGRLARWTLVAGASCASCGAITGMLFAAFARLLGGEPWSLATVGGYFALCGGLAGALMAAAAAMMETSATGADSAIDDRCAERTSAGDDVEFRREPVERPGLAANRLAADSPAAYDSIMKLTGSRIAAASLPSGEPQ